MLADKHSGEIKEGAELYRRGLLLGLLSVSDAITWLDVVIASEAKPDIAIIEASLSGSRGPIAVADWLKEVPGPFDERAVAGRLLGKMHGGLVDGALPPATVTRWLFQMAMDGDAPDDQAEGQMLGLDDELSLAADGIVGSVPEIRDRLEQFLRAYV
jgi:hypothetical protein